MVVLQDGLFLIHQIVMVSDRQIIEDSKLLGNSTFSSGGIIITHRGIMVQDLFAIKMCL